MRNVMNSFISWTILKNYSPRTTDAFKQVLSDFISYIEYKWIKDYECVKLEHIDDYLCAVSQRPAWRQSRYKETTTISQNTVRWYARNVRSFRKRLNMREYKVFNYEFITIPKEEQVRIDFLENDELQQFFDLANLEERVDTRERNLLIFEMLYKTWMRISELMSLRFSDIPENWRLVKIKGKWGKLRDIPINDDIKRKIFKYRRFRVNPVKYINRNVVSNDDWWYIFIVHSDSNYGWKLRGGRVEEILKKYRTMIGLTKYVSCHTFRHTFATHLLRRWADLKKIQELLGHSSIRTTEKYLHLTDQDLINTVDLLMKVD